jgi:hypothetical protein
MPEKRKILMPEAPPERAATPTNDSAKTKKGADVPIKPATKSIPPPLPKLQSDRKTNGNNKPPEKLVAVTPPLPSATTSRGAKSLPPELLDVTNREFTVKMGGFFFGDKYRLTVKDSTLSFVNLKSGFEITFDPANEFHDFTLRNPWTSGSDEHVIIETKKRERFAFTIPVKAWPTLRDWWQRMKP